jgi:hypothetical protein
MVVQEKFLTSFRIRLMLLTAIGLIVGWIMGKFCPDPHQEFPLTFIFLVGVLSNFIQFGLLPSLLSLSYGRKKQALILSIIPLILSVPGAFVGVLSGFAVAFLTSCLLSLLGLLIRPVLSFVFGMSLDQTASVYGSSVITIASALAMLSGSAIVVGLTCMVQRHFFKNTTYLPSTKLIFKGTIVSVLIVCLFLKPWAWSTKEFREALFGLPKNLAISLSVLPLFLLWIIRGEEAKTPNSIRPDLKDK